jgi:hypothetical protein
MGLPKPPLANAQKQDLCMSYGFAAGYWHVAFGVHDGVPGKIALGERADNILPAIVFVSCW